MHNRDETLIEVIKLAEQLKSKAEAAAKLGVKERTILRYYQEARARGLITDEGLQEESKNLPVVYVLDVENAPTKASVFRFWKENIRNDQILEEWYMLSWALKPLFSTGENTIISDVLTPEEAKKGDDRRIMESIWPYVDEADIIIGHNLDKFDMLKLNSRWAPYGINPPMPYQTIDTLIGAKKNFSFSSNKLDYLAKVFGVTRKADNGGMARWNLCLEGDPQSLLDMEAYNRVDLLPTEEIYLCMRPYLKAHPNMGLFFSADSDVCYKCGSMDLDWSSNKFYYTGVNKYPMYRCRDCNSPGRSRFSALSKEERVHITSPIYR